VCVACRMSADMLLIIDYAKAAYKDYGAKHRHRLRRVLEPPPRIEVRERPGPLPATVCRPRGARGEGGGGVHSDESRRLGPTRNRRATTTTIFSPSESTAQWSCSALVPCTRTSIAASELICQRCTLRTSTAPRPCRLTCLRPNWQVGQFVTLLTIN